MRECFHLAYNVRMSAKESDAAEVLLYGEIVQDYGKFYKEVYQNDKCAADFDKEIRAVREKGAKKLTLRINSPGGVVWEAVAMRSILVNAGFEEITVRIEGLCASAATILATIPTAKAQIAEGSEYMIHDPWTIAMGFASDLEAVADHLRGMEKSIAGFYGAKSGQSEEQIRGWMDAEEWMTAEEAVERGFCDEMLTAGTMEPAAACVRQEDMEIMKAMYRTIPENIHVSGSNAHPVAGSTSTNIINKEEPQTMEIKDITREQLLAENPALAEEIRSAAITAERERQADIDALTVPGYEALAEEAKKNGTSAVDFQKSIVKAMKEKGNAFLQGRQQETQAAAQVVGGSASDGNEEEELKAFAKEMAGYAESSKNETMF